MMCVVESRVLDSSYVRLFSVAQFIILFTWSLQRERKNLQDLNGVYVFNVAEREFLDRPTARLIKEVDHLEGNFFGVVSVVNV